MPEHKDVQITVQEEGINAHGFGLVYKCVMRDREISAAEKGIYAYFCSISGSGGTTYTSRARMLMEMGLGKDAYYSHRAKLIDNGYVTYKQENAGGKGNGFGRNIITIIARPAKHEKAILTAQQEKGILTNDGTMKLLGYGTIPRTVMTDPELHIISKALYAYFAAFAGCSQIAVISESITCAELALSPYSYRKYIKELTNLQYITLQNGEGEDAGKTIVLLMDKLHVVASGKSADVQDLGTGVAVPSGVVSDGENQANALQACPPAVDALNLAPNKICTRKKPDTQKPEGAKNPDTQKNRTRKNPDTQKPEGAKKPDMQKNQTRKIVVIKKTVHANAKKQDTVKPDAVNQDMVKPYTINNSSIQATDTTINSFSTINLSAPPAQQTARQQQAETVWIDGLNAVKEQIGYWALNYDMTSGISHNQIAELDAIVEVIAGVLLYPKGSYTINGSRIPGAVVQERFRSLDKFHVEYVLECLESNQQKIINMIGYLRTALYNAPATIETYYTAQVAADELARISGS